jgi:hypothetical protein
MAKSATTSFITSSPGAWDAAPLEKALLAEADRMVGGADAWLIVDDTALSKKGEHSVGVAPQYASSLGKTANCQSLVSLTLASREVPVMIGLRLFLPESWTSDPERMARARVPEDRRTALTKPEIAIEEIDRVIASGARFGCVLADSVWGLPKRLRSSIARIMQSPIVQGGWEWASRGAVATTLHAIAIWAWHAPVLFDAAVTNVALHRLQHLCFFATAVLFWWSVLWRSDRGAAAGHLFLTMLHTSILGALMALAPRVLYARVSEAWGLTPLEDQQLAGMVMWIPAGTIYAGAALTLLALWISTSGRGGGHAQRLSPF